MFKYLLAIVAFLGSIALGVFVGIRPAPVQHGVVMEILDPSLTQFAPLWQKEISRRFPDAVGVLCHGGNFVGDQWIVSAKAYERNLTAQDIARYEQARYPGKVIVLLCCNPGHLDLGIKGVYFAPDSVWCVPDRSLGDLPDRAADILDSGYEPTLGRWNEEPGIVGNIYEFISD